MSLPWMQQSLISPSPPCMAAPRLPPGFGQVSAQVLARLLQNAEEAIGKEVTKAVISVPAYFDDEQKAATTAAGQIAGLETVRLIRCAKPPPSAAGTPSPYLPSLVSSLSMSPFSVLYRPSLLSRIPQINHMDGAAPNAHGSLCCKRGNC